MTATLDAPSTAERRAQIVPPALHQVEGLAEVLHSANAGVVVDKVGQLRSEFRNEGRVFAREVAKHVNARQGGNATAFVYEETFGYEDRVHFLIHLRGLDTYYDMVEMGDQDAAYRASIAKERVGGDTGGGAWDRLFVDGTVRSSVLLPRGPATGAELNSATAGIVLHRSARAGYGRGAEAVEAAHRLAGRINAEFAGAASAVLYDEAFGDADTLHWLVHLRDITVYRSLLDGGVFAAEAQPGTFVDGSFADVALTPHHWGLYATRQQSG
jgi:hypothetical protein